MKRPQIIGLTARKQSGKSTVAGMLDGYVPLSFAAPIKRVTYAMGLTPEEAAQKETVVERFGKTPRQLWQGLGTWAREEIHDDIWVRIARAEAESVLRFGRGLVVFDDVRFDNEAEMIRDLGGEIWQVRRFKAEEVYDGHVSERGIDHDLIHRSLDNNGDLDSLRRQVRAILGYRTYVEAA